jgi:DNA-binding HxlR family transcriptional regulator
VRRRALTPSHLGVKYSLTPYAATLNPVFTALLSWGSRHLDREDRSATDIWRWRK